MAEERKKTEPKKKAAPRKKKAAPVPAAEEAKPQAVPPVEVPAPAPKPPKPPKVPKVTGPKYYGTGRRKEAVAKVWLTPGSGKMLVNQRPPEQYFCSRKILEFFVNRPLVATQTAGKYDVYAEAFGGGIPGQAGAVGLGIARALVQLNPELKGLLKREGLLTRDPRMKERKKYGLKRARRAFQYTKR